MHLFFKYKQPESPEVEPQSLRWPLRAQRLCRMHSCTDACASCCTKRVCLQDFSTGDLLKDRRRFCFFWAAGREKPESVHCRHHNQAGRQPPSELKV